MDRCLRGRHVGARVLPRAPVAARFLVPILVLLYIAPFIAAPERMTQVARRIRSGGRDDPPRPPMKNVTPPDPPAGTE
jgi:hypothetical protein